MAHPAGWVAQRQEALPCRPNQQLTAVRTRAIKIFITSSPFSRVAHPAGWVAQRQEALPCRPNQQLTVVRTRANKIFKTSSPFSRQFAKIRG